MKFIEATIEANKKAKKRTEENKELRRWVIEGWPIIISELTEDDLVSMADDATIPVVIRNLARQHLGFLDIGQDG